MNHKQDAREYLRLAVLESAPEWATVHTAHAQAHATLALVEQQRIANLITLFRIESENTSTPMDAMRAIYDLSEPKSLRTQPEIMSALGIGENQ